MEELLKKLNYQPADLSNIDLDNPERVVNTFFENYPIDKTREHLWELYKGWTYHAAEYTDAEQTRSMIFFYTEMIDFFNASFICAEKRKEEV